jgi:hypothetical protein
VLAAVDLHVLWLGVPAARAGGQITRGIIIYFGYHSSAETTHGIDVTFCSGGVMDADEQAARQHIGEDTTRLETETRYSNCKRHFSYALHE